MLISIIITAYNIEEYIEQAIMSALRQVKITKSHNTFDTEVIVIDDCSTDNTYSVIEKLLNETNNGFKVLKSGKNNSGAGVARKVGISEAKGDYILLLDGDDWLETDYISQLVEVALKTDADIVGGGIIVNKPNKIVESYTYGECELTGEDKVTRFFGERVVFMNNKIIKRHLHEKIPYCTRRFIEDTPVIIPQLYLANKVVYVNCAGYHYRMVDNSLTHQASDLKYKVYRALCLRDLMEFFKDKPKGGWCDIVNFDSLLNLVMPVVVSKPTIDEIMSLGTDALKDWAEFSTLAFESIVLYIQMNNKTNTNVSK